MDDNTSQLGFGPGAARSGFGNHVIGRTNMTNVIPDPIWGLGARYTGTFSGGSFGVGIGYQFTNDALELDPGPIKFKVLGLSAHVALDSGLSAALNYSAYDVDRPSLNQTDGTHMGVGASYTFDAVTLHANYGAVDWDANAGAFDAAGYGLSASYDLGGGLSANFGYGWSEVTATNNGASGFGQTPPMSPPIGSSSNWSLGMSMSF
jgi:outer membrane protein OmpU